MRGRAGRWDRIDPRTPEIEALVRDRAPAEELAVRLALNGLCARCRADGPWTARIEQLQRQVVGQDEDVMADVLRSAAKIGAMVRELVGD